MSNKILSDLFDGVVKAVKDISVAFNDFSGKQQDETKPQLLTAQKLQELKWMNPRQLASIYQYGKVKTHIDDDPEAFRELKWMSPAQLEAIFGKEGFN